MDGKSNPVEKKTPTGLSRYRKGLVKAASLYGKVRYAIDVVTNEWVIIKQCLIERLESHTTAFGQHVAEDIHKEIEIHRKLSQDEEPCDSIIEFRDHCQDAKNIYIVLELATEGDLFNHVLHKTNELLSLWNTKSIHHEVKQEKLLIWQNKVRKWMQKILQALKFMHERNICHRDISLENIVMCKGMIVKLIDFGVAHEYKDGNFRTERSPIGKATYMSPECGCNHYYDGRQNDLWAFGVGLWMCLIGAPPWDHANIVDQRFCFIMQGVSGIKGLLQRWGRTFMCPDSAVDLLSKIFRPEKDRITVDEALKHPFFTGSKHGLVPDFYIPAEITNQQIDAGMCLKWEALRGKRNLEPPPVWIHISEDLKRKIIKFLWRVNKHKGTIFEMRVVRDMAVNFNIKAGDVREILIWFMAATRNRARLPESFLRLKPSPLLQFNASERKAKLNHVSEQKAKENHVSEQKAKENHVSEQKAQEKHVEGRLLNRALPEHEEKQELVLKASFKKDEQDTDISYPLTVKAGATLNQIKVDFALLRTKKLSSPFITPSELEILVNGKGLEDTSMLREGSIIRGKTNGECAVPQWFRELAQKGMLLNDSTDEQCQQKFLEMLQTKFNLDPTKCLEIWKHFTQNSGIYEEPGDHNARGGNAAEYDWLKVLYTDAKGKWFALLLSAIVFANIEDKNACIVLLQQKGLTRDKALQAIKFFSGKLGEV